VALTHGPTLVSLACLLLAILSVWLPRGPGRVPFWSVPYVLFAAQATWADLLAPTALVALGLLPLLAWAQRHPALPMPVRRGLEGATIALCFAMVVRLWPGFREIVLLSDLRLGADAPPFRLTASLDAGVAGLFMLALYAPRATTLDAWRGVLRHAVPVALVGTGVVMASAVAVGYLRWDPKLPWFAWLHVVKTVFWTCVVEESFFRGIVLERLLRRGWGWAALLLSSALFALVHFRGGAALVGLAGLAGLGYGWAYMRTRRIEAAIVAHATLNATHFFLFTYPRLDGG
jgi:membrane protease YdiL (CAAX protease family)